MEPSERVIFGVVGAVGVDLERRADPGVAEDGLGVASRDTEVFQERGNSVPDVVNGDHPYVVVVADTAEGSDEVAWLDRAAGPGGEDEIRIWPGSAHVRAVAGLPVDLCREGLPGEVQQGKRSLAGAGLGRAELELTADALDLLADVDGPAIEVD